MRTEGVLARVKQVRPSRLGWVALCPAHLDRSPSLSIREGEDGRTLVHCFAGCTVGSIVAALGLKLSDLFAAPYSPGDSKPIIVRRAAQQIADLRSRLTPTERETEVPVTVVYCDQGHLDAGIARALALAVVKREIVQALLSDSR
jgi:hypothetical protein